MPRLKRARVMKSCSFNGMAKTFLPPPRDHFCWSSGNCLTVTNVSSLASRYSHRTSKALPIWKSSVKVHLLWTVFKPLQTELLNHGIHTFQQLLRVNNLLLSYLQFALNKLQVGWGGGQAAQLILLSYGHAVLCANWMPNLRRPPSMQKRGAQHLSSVEHLLPSVPDNTGRP